MVWNVCIKDFCYTNRYFTKINKDNICFIKFQKTNYITNFILDWLWICTLPAHAHLPPHLHVHKPLHMLSVYKRKNITAGIPKKGLQFHGFNQALLSCWNQCWRSIPFFWWIGGWKSNGPLKNLFETGFANSFSFSSSLFL